ncbi:MAG: prenyltransferase [Candidatus Eremiobacteraeota bacterium]|nr:prenyltransferase [Candidatus Eremiobacteraeota bacterium]
MKAGTLQDWAALARLPFHTVGVFPFILGSVLAWRETGAFNWPVILWGTLAVILIMAATYLAGEYYDYDVDTLSGKMEKNRFSGGSGVLQKGIMPRHYPLVASIVSLGAAAAIGIVIQLVYRTGPLTIPMGAFGIVCGYFYSTRPIRWSARGVGEILIGICYGWLTVATSYYLQTGIITPFVTLVSFPIGFTIFNVILINEFPDYPADMEDGKKTLVVRFGKEKSAVFYMLASLGAWISYILIAVAWPSFTALYAGLPFLLLSVATTLEVARGDWRRRENLERICAKTIVINLGLSAALIAAALIR